MTRFGRTDLPPEQAKALRAAIKIEWFTIAYTTVTIALVALVVGNSQAMKTAWIEDILSLLPQISFLVALILVRRPPTRAFPFGLHRTMGIGHLVAGVALLAIGGNLAVEAVIGLVTGEHPTIGTVVIFGNTIWLGWLMVAVMSLIVIGPFFYGRAKSKVAPTLHNKVLFADADMAKADWSTNAASVVGVLGIGVGLWWLDGAAALFISLGIFWDGIKNTRSAVLDLMDQRARSVDDEEPHPLIAVTIDYLRAQPWIEDAGVRMRDEGQVFHVEAFVVPRRGKATLAQIDRATAGISDLDWKMQDVVVILVDTVPAEARDERRAAAE